MCAVVQEKSAKLMQSKLIQYNSTLYETNIFPKPSILHYTLSFYMTDRSINR